jgi:hypothetical protein
LSDKIGTGVYLTVLQHERLHAMAKALDRSASWLVSKWIDEAWVRYLAEKEDSPTEKQEVV